MNESTIALTELARVIRSKNAGPFELTLDVFFNDHHAFETARDANVIDKPLIAKIYRVNLDEVLGVTWFEPANALKITLRRAISSAAPGDADVFGAQQHVPLMRLEIPRKTKAN